MYIYICICICMCIYYIYTSLHLHAFVTFTDLHSCTSVRTWLAAQDLQVTDPDVLFKLLDDGDKQLTAEALSQGHVVPL
jgi:hypothetical protein